MPSKQRLDYLKSARATTVQASKKKKSKASLILNVHLEVKNDKLNTINTSNIKGKSRTQFWNKNANKSYLDTEKEEDEDEEKKNEDKEKKDDNQEEEESRTQKVVSLGILKMEIKWNRQEEDNF